MPPLTHARLLMSGLLLTCGLSCSSLSRLGDPDTAVVYALGSVDGFPSPIASKLQPACPALTFSGESFSLTSRHHIPLEKLATQWQQTPRRLIAVGYASPRLPEDYARGLSGRRAQAVRQHLIELGIEPAEIQTLGLGSDFAPSGPSSGVVVIYTVEDAPPPAPAEQPPATPTESGSPVASR